MGGVKLIIKQLQILSIWSGEFFSFEKFLFGTFAKMLLNELFRKIDEQSQAHLALPCREKVCESERHRFKQF